MCILLVEVMVYVGVGITDPNKSLKDVSWGLLKHHLSIIPISEI